MLNLKEDLEMTGKELISCFFKDQGIKEVFCLPGIHILPIVESLIRSGISLYFARCERSLLFMADGYSRASGKPAIVFVTPGPGITSSVLGSYEAFWSEVPILLIHVYSVEGTLGKGALHELSHPESIFEEITKRIIKVEKKEDLSSLLRESLFLTLKGRPGPVLLSIPSEFLEKDITGLDFLSSEEEGGDDEDFATKLEKFLYRKKRPVIIAGWGMMAEEARLILDEVCSKAQIPVLTTTGGKGVVDERKPYAFGNVIQKRTVSKILEEADAVIAIGTRLREVDTKRRGVKIKSLVHVDIDGRYFDRNYKAELKGTGGIKGYLEAIKSVTERKRFGWRIEELKSNYLRDMEGLSREKGFRIIRTIRESIPEETITVWDLNILSYWAEYYFPVYEQRTFFMPRGSSTIFYALPGAIGAKIAKVDLPCLSICGDGGVLPAIGELSTIAKYRIPLVLLIYNNMGFGVLESVMRKRYQISGSMGLRNPDFLKIANAFGFEGKKVKSEEELARILREVSWEEPFVVELCLPIFESPWEV